MKTLNHKGWFFVLPVVLLVAFNALIPMMTVVNYSVQETFGNNLFFWEGLGWFEKLLHSDRFHAALGRQFLFTGLILMIEVPLGIAIALSMPRQGFWVPVCLVLMALPMLIPWNVVGAMWNIFTLPDIGLLGYFMNYSLGIDYDMTQNPIAAWITIITMDVWHWTSLVVLLCYAGLVSIPDAYYQAAKIDGANWFHVMTKIEIPSILSFVLLGVVLRLIECIRLFDIIYITTKGGPGIATEVMAFFTYRTEFRSFQIGTGSASAVIILIISLIVTTIAVTLLRRVEKNEGLS